MHARHQLAVSVLALLGSTCVAARDTTLCWPPTTHDLDGTPVDDLAGYRLYSGCQTIGVYERAVVVVEESERAPVVGAPLRSYVMTGLPERACYFVVTAFDLSGNESPPSPPAAPGNCAAGPPPVLVVPGPVRNLVVTPVATPPPTSGSITLNLVMWASTLQFTMTVEGSPFDTLTLELLGGAQFDEITWPTGTLPNVGGNNDGLRSATLQLNRVALPQNVRGDIDPDVLPTGARVTINGVTRTLGALYPPGGFPQGFGGRVDF